MLSEREKLRFFVSLPWIFGPEPEVLVWEEGKNQEAATSPTCCCCKSKRGTGPSRQDGSNGKTQL